jgi:uncharacterized protein (TIGR00251 family)
LALPFLERRKDGIRIRLHIQPGANRNQIVGVHGDALKVKVRAAPEDGRANAELLRFLADVLQLPKRQLTLVTGQTSRRKIVELALSDGEEVEKTLSGLLKGN